MSAPSVLVVGEPLAELRPRGDGALDLSFSGDALNVGVRLARGGAAVDLATAVGTDRFSGRLLERLADEGVGRRLVHREPDGALGLYLVELDGAERCFTYWRGASPARRLVDLVGSETLGAAAAAADVVVVSGVTLAILDDRQRGALIDLLTRAAAGSACVAVDPNVRPRLWSSTAEARRWVDAAVGVASIVLSSSQDLALLGVDAVSWVAPDRELVVTDGAGATRWWSGGRSGAVEVPPAATVDTTGAGDAFDAAFLLARWSGATVPDAVASGHEAAAEAVGHAGGLRWPAPAG